MRSLRALCAIALLIASVRVAAADDAAAGYARVRPSLVKVWAFDAAGRPVESGTGLVIVSNASRSLVLTAAHVIDGAATIRIDVDRDQHDLLARVQQRGPRDLALLAVARGGFTPATFASRGRTPVEGNLIAVAGFVEHDELIGVVGQEPRLLYPGTISSRPDDGAYLELENVHIEEGLSGGPVFDPDTGDVVGIVTSRTADQRGGFADSGALVVVPFLASSAIAFTQRGEPARIAAAHTAAPHVVPPHVATPHVAPSHGVVAPPTRPPIVVAAAPAPAITLAPRALPSVQRLPHVWSVLERQAHRYVYDRAGCAIALSLAVRQLSFTQPVEADGDALLAGARLSLRVGREVAPVAACANVAAASPADAPYIAQAASYNGHHVTIRFRYNGVDGEDDALFPADVSLDADLDTAPATAHVQLIDADWDDALDVSASRDP